jgi:anti-anti-sigma factor
MSSQHIAARSAVPGHPVSLLSVQVTARGPITVVTVGGELDMSNAHLFTDLIEHVLEQEPLRLVLDLAGLTFFCAEGVRALQRVQAAITAAAGDLILLNPSPITMKVLALTRTIGLFRIEAAA